MNRYLSYRLYEAALPAEICDCIVRLGSELTVSKATVVSANAGPQEDTNIRETDVAFWDATHWISGLLVHFAMRANQETWQYSLTVAEGVQYGVYREGAKYDWHKDEFDQPYGKEERLHWRGLNRKITVVANLSPSDTYSGGDLVFKDTFGVELNDPEEAKRQRQRGSVVVFPGYIVHKVSPVTHGRRHSIVSWVLGPPFK